MKKFFYRITRRCIDLVFPQPRRVAALENATAHEINERAAPAPATQHPTLSACFSYKDPLIQQAIWEIKYRGNRRIIALFAEILADHIQAEFTERTPVESFSSPVVISSVPMPRKRLKERGWNQSDLLARATTDALNAPWATYEPHILKRTRASRPQTELSRAERLENMRGAFEVREPTKLVNRIVILIDDVTTTGATYTAARAALINAGAREVMGFAVAH
ncbi:MAG: hypothetical protein WD049_02220 [Candidatus Paceibacterota bacterium]